MKCQKWETSLYFCLQRRIFCWSLCQKLWHIKGRSVRKGIQFLEELLIANLRLKQIVALNVSSREVFCKGLTSSTSNWNTKFSMRQHWIAIFICQDRILLGPQLLLFVSCKCLAFSLSSPCLSTPHPSPPVPWDIKHRLKLSRLWSRPGMPSVFEDLWAVYKLSIIQVTSINVSQHSQMQGSDELLLLCHQCDPFPAFSI